jgi:hypothetical protein
MPYIKVIDGAMREFSTTGTDLGLVNSIGFNAYSYLERRAWSAGLGTTGADNPDYTVDFPWLSSQGFKYLQVMVAPFSAAGAAGWNAIVGVPTFNADNTVASLNINAAYWAVMDAFFDSARSYNIGIIACPYWSASTVPTITNIAETNADLANYNSKSNNYMRAFAAAFATRYTTHTGIAAWMAGQELTVGVPTLSITEMSMVLKSVATAIRTNDSLGRMISSGNAAVAHFEPRRITLQRHLQYAVPTLNPDPIDCICENPFITNEYVSSGRASNAQNPMNFTSQSLGYLKEMQKTAQALGKPYLVGSFGVSIAQESALTDTVAQANLTTFLNNMSATGVQLACYWVWNAKPTFDGTWNLLTGSGTDNGRIPVYSALKTSLDMRTSKKSISAPMLNLRRGRRVAPFDKALNFGANNVNTNGITIPHIAAYAAPDMTFGYSIRNRGKAARDGQVFITKQGSNAGWNLSELNGIQYMQLWNGTTFTLNSAGANQLPVPSADDFTSIIWTVKQNAGISVFQDAWLMQQTGVMSSAWAPGASPLVVGRTTSNNVVPFSSDICGMFMLDHAMTPKEAYDYWADNKLVAPVGKWDLNGDLLDSSGNGNHAMVAVNQTAPSFINISQLSRLARQ